MQVQTALKIGEPPPARGVGAVGGTGRKKRGAAAMEPAATSVDDGDPSGRDDGDDYSDDNEGRFDDDSAAAAIAAAATRNTKEAKAPTSATVRHGTTAGSTYSKRRKLNSHRQEEHEHDEEENEKDDEEGTAGLRGQYELTEEERIHKKKESNAIKKVKERQRRSKMSGSIHELRHILPACREDPRVNQAVVMMRAVEHIRRLETQLRDMADENTRLKAALSVFEAQQESSSDVPTHTSAPATTIRQSTTSPRAETAAPRASIYRERSSTAAAPATNYSNSRDSQTSAVGTSAYSTAPESQQPSRRTRGSRHTVKSATTIDSSAISTQTSVAEKPSSSVVASSLSSSTWLDRQLQQATLSPPTFASVPAPTKLVADSMVLESPSQTPPQPPSVRSASPTMGAWAAKRPGAQKDPSLVEISSGRPGIGAGDKYPAPLHLSQYGATPPAASKSNFQGIMITDQDLEGDIYSLNDIEDVGEWPLYFRPPSSSQTHQHTGQHIELCETDSVPGSALSLNMFHDDFDINPSPSQSGSYVAAPVGGAVTPPASARHSPYHTTQQQYQYRPGFL